MHHADFPPASRVLPICITPAFRLYHGCYQFASR